MSTDTPKAPPGCEPIEGGAAYQITDGEAFLNAIRPAIEAGLAHIEDAPSERTGEGWSGAITCHACPVQIEGTVDGMHFYFRARWDAWTFGIGRTDDEAVDATWKPSGRSWCTGGNDASGEAFASSWMPHSEAWKHVEASIAEWRARGVR